MGKRYYLFFLLSVIPFILLAQDGYFKIQKISDKEGYIFFPILSGRDSYVVSKINTHLQLGELEILYKENNKDIFEQVTRQQIGIYGRKTDIDYNILSNTKQNFAVCFTETSCGMTCNYWVSYHNFNPLNGDKYLLKDFFSEPEYKNFHAYVTDKRQANIKRQLLAPEYKIDYEEFADELLELISNDELNSFYFTEDSIYFDNFNLLSKNSPFHGLDHITGISINEIRKFLSDFEFMVLVNGKEGVNYKSRTEPQLYEGIICSNLKIYLLFRNEYDNDYIGIYAYEKYKKGINLRGKIVNNKIVLTECDDELEEVAELTFTKKGKRLSGTWKDLRTKKTCLFSAVRK